MERFSTISENLLTLLLKNPEKYYEELCDLKNKYNMDLIKKILNCSHYQSYMGNHLHSLVYVVGDLFYEETKEKNIIGSKISVSEDLGIKILDKLVEYNIDLYAENYYQETPLQNLKSDGYTKRKNNLKFKKKLEKYYIDDLNNGLLKSLEN
tara:strand:- start:5 stop:460 length:456 start_codon:yes stop_codon:yes gene_type:complete